MQKNKVHDLKTRYMHKDNAKGNYNQHREEDNHSARSEKQPKLEA